MDSSLSQSPGLLVNSFSPHLSFAPVPLASLEYSQVGLTCFVSDTSYGLLRVLVHRNSKAHYALPSKLHSKHTVAGPLLLRSS
jgi:hypothetical protein